ncbi:Protein atp12, mitochondrial [Neolecta irregularis DAH-3]|uniref:Protein atp12, mitochondrial n=1 Tax=Neolecta irregularis (strain DAH-3) TaxID=1198029 RepID=A0A1U7LM56_NEOID|nr:Protein atp12, mitochondrial [Neolecta irregularis DAH-3]|eukprot:OLL23750.1 Protein atp12, mitochondrial [Neolecta irregularis DAH-3]
MIFQRAFLKLPSQTRASKVARRASHESTLQRFWKTVNVSSSLEGYKVLLDACPIKTLTKQDLTIPSDKKDLAYAIAHEWDSLRNSKVKHYELPITSIVSRAIYMEPQEARKTVLLYLKGDTVLYLSEADQCDGKLRAIQEAEFPRLKEWAEDLWQTKLGFSTGFGAPFVEKPSYVYEWVCSLDNWQLAGLERGVIAMKSLILGAALIEGRISAEQCVYLARLEVALQSQRWGEVEDGHDVDHEDLKRQVGSVSAVVS